MQFYYIRPQVAALASTLLNFLQSQRYWTKPRVILEIIKMLQGNLKKYKSRGCKTFDFQYTIGDIDIR